MCGKIDFNTHYMQFSFRDVVQQQNRDINNQFSMSWFEIVKFKVGEAVLS